MFNDCFDHNACPPASLLFAPGLRTIQVLFLWKKPISRKKSYPKKKKKKKMHLLIFSC
jgi:hypothetical protein